MMLYMTYFGPKTIGEIIFNEFFSWYQFILGCLPGQIGTIIRSALLKPFFQSCGQNLVIAQNVYISHPSHIILGDNVSFNCGCVIDGAGGIEIGNDVLIAQYCSLVTAEHNYQDPKLAFIKQGWKLSPIKINHNVWIAANSIITSGVKIGSHVVVGAGAVVTKNISSHQLVGGVPAKMIKSISHE